MTPSSESIDTPDTTETPSKSPPRRRPAQDLITIREDTLPDTEGLCEEELDEIYEAAKQKDYKLSELQVMTMQELMHLAGKEGVQSTSGMGKQELVFELLKARVMNAGLGWGEGVLDILPDGFGFLRSPSHCYAAGPDDIYVSPSQIRRLNLRPGHLVAGPIRPPKDGERYFALLRVEAIENGPVDELQTRIPFDDLTPLLPDERLSLDHQGCG
ncbi:MAG: Rho termination factor N-terminal domain-containing protein, partial [Planctomycetota bacterium]|nr:Rho termination factor N-terminal domain-containing protein [Planctomycetota bacterium]